MRKRILFCALAVLLVLTAASCGTPQTSGGTQSVPLTDTAGQEATRTPQYDPALPQDREDAPGMPGDTPTNAEESEAANPAQTASQPEGKFGPLFEQYVHSPVSDGAYTISMQQSGISMVTTVTGGDSALDSNMANVLHITLINQGGKYYMLMHGTKKYAEMTAEDYAKQVASLQTASLDLENVRFLESGTQTVGGKQCVPRRTARRTMWNRSRSGTRRIWICSPFRPASNW